MPLDRVMASLVEQQPAPAEASKRSELVRVMATARNWALSLVVVGFLFKLVWIFWCLRDGALRLQGWEWITLPIISSYQHLLFGLACFVIFAVLMLPSLLAPPLKAIGFVLLSGIQVTAVLYFMTALRMAQIMGTLPTYGLLEAGSRGGVLGSSMISPENLPYTIGGSIIAALTVALSFVINRRWPRWPRRRRMLLTTGVLLLWVSVGLEASAHIRSELHQTDLEPVSFFFTELLQQHADQNREAPEHDPGAFPTAMIYGRDDFEETRHHFQNLDRWRQTNRNVVLIVLESVHVKNASYAIGPVEINGERRDTMPNISKLRENMLIMENHYTVHPTSMESLFAINCSLYPYPLRPVITDVNPRIPCGSLPETLVDAGYTAGLYHSGHFTFWNKDRFFSDRGFEVMYDADTMPRREGAFEYNWGLDERVAVDNIVDFIHENRDRSFFVEYIPVFPHSPYTLPDESLRTFEGEERIDGYHNALHYVDGALQTIVDALHEDELIDDTLLIVIADHGEAFDEHPGNRSHSAFIYEENVHIPFGIHNPIIFSGAPSIDRVTNHTDVLPTIAELLDLPANPSWQGRSLLEDGPSLLTYFYSVTGRQLVGLRDGRYKVIWNRSTRTMELFDLLLDPGEQRNVAHLFEDRIGPYQQALTQWRSYQLALIPRFGLQREGAEEGRHWLADLRPNWVYQPHNYDPVADHSVAGRNLLVDWVSYDHGLGTHADSWYTFDIAELGATRFVGRVGRDRRMNNGVVYAAVFIDGRLALATDALEAGTPAVGFDLDVEGAREVSLVSWTGTDSGRSDHVNWGELVLLSSEEHSFQHGREAYLDELRPSGANEAGLAAEGIPAQSHSRVHVGDERLTRGLLIPGGATIHYDVRPLGATRLLGRLMPRGQGEGASAELIQIFFDDVEVWSGHPNQLDEPESIAIDVPAEARLLTLRSSETDPFAARVVLDELRLETSEAAYGAGCEQMRDGPVRPWHLALVPPRPLDEEENLIGWSRGPDGAWLEIDGADTPKSFWTRAGSTLHFDLRDLQARNLSGRLGVAGDEDCHLRATIRATEESEPLWSSEDLDRSSETVTFEIPLEADSLILQTTGDDGCHLVWAEPVLFPESLEPLED